MKKIIQVFIGFALAVMMLVTYVACKAAETVLSVADAALPFGGVSGQINLAQALSEFFSPTLIGGSASRQACVTVDASTNISVPDAALSGDTTTAIISEAQGNNRRALELFAAYGYATEFGTKDNRVGEIGPFGLTPEGFQAVYVTPDQLNNPAVATSLMSKRLDKAEEGIEESLWKNGDPTIVLGIILSRAYRLETDLDNPTVLSLYQKSAEVMRVNGFSLSFENNSASWINTTVPETFLPVVNTTQERKLQIWTYLRQKGFQPWQAAGIMGNIAQESMFDPRAIEAPSGAGHGLAQWSFDRWKSNATRGSPDPSDASLSDEDSLWGWAQLRGRDWQEMGLQLDFMWHEVSEGNRKGSLEALKGLELDPKTQTAAAAAVSWSKNYEQASVSASNDPRRIAEAQNILLEFQFLPVQTYAEACKAANISAADRGSAGSSPNRQSAVNAALTQLGVRYSWGGGNVNGISVGTSYDCSAACFRYSDPTTPGWDCSGLVQYAIYKGAGVTLPRNSSYQRMALQDFQVTREQLQPGDLLFWDGHVAMYIGNNRMIEAPQSGDKVKISPIRDGVILYGDPFAWAAAGNGGG